MLTCIHGQSEPKVTVYLQKIISIFRLPGEALFKETIKLHCLRTEGLVTVRATSHMGHNTSDKEVTTLVPRMKEFIICSIGGHLAHLLDVLYHQVYLHSSITLCFHFSVTTMKLLQSPVTHD